MTNHGTRAALGPRRASSRTAAPVIAGALFALLAACGGSPLPTGSGGSPRVEVAGSPSAVAYSACMRSHGVPTFPDPDPASGQVSKAGAQELGVSASRLEAAQQACQSLYPTNGGSLSDSLRECEETGDCPQAVVQQAMTQLRAFALCMRSHGVPTWPDPTIDAQGRPEVVIKPWEVGFDPDSPRISNTMQGCLGAMNPRVPPPLEVWLPPTGASG